MSNFEQYVHHNPGRSVWVRKRNKGMHRHNCLCHNCELFEPNTSQNCLIAQAVFALCEWKDLVLPVWECPEFEEKS